MRVTIRNVAAEAGVSVTTASRALKGEGRMQPETRERVRAAALRLGYRPNSMARGLVQKRSFTLGLLTNDTYGRFTLPVAAGLAGATVDRGVSVFLAAAQDDPDLMRLNLEAMEEKRIDGLVIAGKRIDRHLPISLPDIGIPTIHVMSACPEGEVGFAPDDHGGARAATQHLIACGRRRIAHLTGPANFEAARLRESGWRQTLEEFALAPPQEASFGDWSEQNGYDMARRLFGDYARGKHPDAVFCGNDQIARGLIDGLSELGIRIPDDVAVIGFDNWEIFAEATRPALTSVDMGLVELGREAGLTLLDMIDGKQVAPGLRHIPCRLVVRKSCGGGQPRNES